MKYGKNGYVLSRAEATAGLWAEARTLLDDSEFRVTTRSYLHGCSESITVPGLRDRREIVIDQCFDYFIQEH